MKKLLLLLCLIVPALSAEAFTPPPTLMYHDIKAVPVNGFDVSIREFCAQLDWLKDNGYTTLNLEDLTASRDIPAKSVVITFDDGYRGIYMYAVPELRKRNMKAVFFVIANMVGVLNTSYPHITETELKDIASDELFSIGSHTMSHPNFDELGHEDRIKELTDSRRVLAEITGRNIDVLAYPYGNYDSELVADAQRTGYRLGFAVDDRNIAGVPENFRIPRIYMGAGVDLKDFVENIPASAFTERYAPLRVSYDIVIAGGGMGGTAAAIQASRLGAKVLIVEPTRMLGGQSTAAGVSTMDDMSRLPESGIYHEFMDRVRAHYAAMNKSIATSYWKTDGKAFEPETGHKILQEMTASSDILFHSQIVSIKPEGKGKRLTITSPEGKKDIYCSILIDATEYGDIIPLAGLRYRSGNSLSPDMNPASMIQDITWTAVIRKYPDGIPEHLRPKNPLPGYDKARKNYLAYVSRNEFGAGSKSPFKLPAEFSAHNGYRAIPDSYLPGNYTGHRKDWKRITKTGVNWGNDYPGQYGWDEKFGLPIAYLESKDFRAEIDREALVKTLHFIYYVQNELSEDWSVDEKEYGELPEVARDLPEEWQRIARYLPPEPYVRECRRIVGEYTYNAKDLHANSESYRSGKKNQELEDAIAIGGYILDLHAGDDDDDFEHELGESQAAIRTYEPAGAFQVPMRILLPESDDSFLAAEKNLSMSRLASGALRLQPVCMMTGQAVGALAGVSLREGVAPRDVKAVRVQKVLADAGVMLSLAEYVDVPPHSGYYPAVQIATLHRLIVPDKYPVYPKQRISTPSKNKRVQGRFGVNRKVKAKEFASMLAKAEKVMGRKIEVAEFRAGMTRGEAVSVIVEAMASLPDAKSAEHRLEQFVPSVNSQDAQ